MTPPTSVSSTCRPASPCRVRQAPKPETVRIGAPPPGGSTRRNCMRRRSAQPAYMAARRRVQLSPLPGSPSCIGASTSSTASDGAPVRASATPASTSQSCRARRAMNSRPRWSAPAPLDASRLARRRAVSADSRTRSTRFRAENTRVRSGRSQRPGSAAASASLSLSARHSGEASRASSPSCRWRRKDRASGLAMGLSTRPARVMPSAGGAGASELSSGPSAGPCGSRNSTSSAAPLLRTNRNWSPSGKRCSTRVAARGASRYWSMALLRGRAPSSAEKPRSSRKSSADGSHSTAHSRLRRPRRCRTSASSLRRIWLRMARVSGLNTTIRSSRLTNSGRKARSTAAITCWSTNTSLVAPKPMPADRWLAAPRLEVRMMKAWRKSATWPLASLSRPSSNTWRNRSQTLLWAFSNSSSKTTLKGCLRTRSTRGSPPVEKPRSPTILLTDSGAWNSLMSSRTSRSADPNRYSARVLASSVLPVPVGPANRNTPIGLSGSTRPAFSMAMRSTTTETASSWPITRSAK